LCKISTCEEKEKKIQVYNGYNDPRKSSALEWKGQGYHGNLRKVYQSRRDATSLRKSSTDIRELI
jgi:hypothetical protein